MLPIHRHIGKRIRYDSVHMVIALFAIDPLLHFPAAGLFHTRCRVEAKKLSFDGFRRRRGLWKQGCQATNYDEQSREIHLSFLKELTVIPELDYEIPI